MINLLNKLIRKFLPEQKIWKIKNRHNIPSMEWSLANIKKLGFKPGFVIDAGAYDGEWTKMFKRIFPSARVLMIEAQSNKETILKAVTEALPDTYFILIY